MNKIIKFLALLMALMMLVTLFTACKRSNDISLEFEDDGTEDIANPDVNENEKDTIADNKVDNKNQNDNQESEKVNTDNQEPEKNNNSQEIEKEDSDNKKEEDEEKVPDNIDDLKNDFVPANKYDPTRNPLIAEAKKPNTGLMPSFDLDTTGFLKKNVKLQDLKGKSFTFLTAVGYGTFFYMDERGKMLSELDWFDSLRKDYGIQVKYIISRFDKNISQSLTYMNSGKALDIIPTHVGSMPVALQLTQPLDPYVNLQNLGNSPGVDNQILEQTKWAGGYRCIAPIGGVDVLWYNQSLVKEFGLTDPHKLWEEGNWNWDTYASFLRSVPKTTSSGKKLYAYCTNAGDAYFSYALANGCAPIEIDNKSSEPHLINNWTDRRCLDAYAAFSSVLQSVQCGGTWGSFWAQGDVMMVDTVTLMTEYDNKVELADYFKSQEFNWVPYPKGTGKDGRDACIWYGYSMALAKKLKNPGNAVYAVKFMELWATRFTEAIFDFQATACNMKFDYAERKEFFDFVTNNTYIGLQMNTGIYLLDKDEQRQVWDAMKAHDPSKNMVTEMTKVANLIEKICKLSVEYGI